MAPATDLDSPGNRGNNNGVKNIRKNQRMSVGISAENRTFPLSSLRDKFSLKIVICVESALKNQLKDEKLDFLVNLG